MSKASNHTTIVKKDPKTGDTYLDLTELLKGTNIDPEDVGYYTLDEETDTKKIVVTFYDKNKKMLKAIKDGEK